MLHRALMLLSVGAMLGACAKGAPSLATASEPAARPRPNVVLIIADDLGFGDVGFNGSTTIRTPNIDALAASGVIFDSGYVAAAVCAPSRAAIFTARHPQRFGYEFNPRGRDAQGVGIPADVPTVPAMMRAAGFRTALIGKWHLGATAEVHPLNRGFDEFFGFVAGGNGYLAKLEEGDLAFQDPVPGSPKGFKAMQLERGYDKVPADSGYLTEHLTDEAVAFIGRNRDQPFFLALTHFAPHSPLQAPRRYLERYPEIKDDMTRTYAAMVTALDDGVGEVVAAIEDAGLRENTIIIFMSDNGCTNYIGAKRCSNQPFAGFKGTYFEGGIRVPMTMSWPGGVPAGKRYDKPVSSMDITTTALAAAGSDWSKANLDGVDLTPFLNDNRKAPHDRLVWRTSPNYAVLRGDWKMWVVERTDGSGSETLLYNLATDQGEARNVASANPEIVTALKGVFAEWDKTVAPPAFSSRRNDSFKHPDGAELNIYN